VAVLFPKSKIILREKGTKWPKNILLATFTYYVLTPWINKLNFN